MFIDVAKIKIVSGKGGDGKVGFHVRSTTPPAGRTAATAAAAARSSSRWMTTSPP